MRLAAEILEQTEMATSVFINEFHYDNAGTDAGEFIEILAPLATSLTGWRLVLYNGANGLSYNTTDLGSLSSTDLGNGFKAVVVNYPSNGIQNGAPDGFALVDDTGAVVQFLSYEGTFTATNGPALGLTSTDIGIAQSGTEPLGSSLQLTGSGTHYEDFTWASTTTNTSGALNAGQILGGVVEAIAPRINEFVFDHVGTDTNEYVEILGAANTDYSAYTLLQIEGDSGSTLGRITSAQSLGSTDASGYWTTGFLNNVYQNGTQTLLLVRNFTGSVNQVLDSNGDGVLDITPWDSVADGIAVTDGGLGDRTYTAAILTPGFGGNSLRVGGASRIPNGTDTDTAADWVRNDFDLAGLPGFPGTPDQGEALNTPGAANAVVDVPPPPPELTAIYTIQGAGQRSALVGQTVTTSGIVTAVDSNGFYLQDATGDGDIATSDAIFVFTGSTPTVAVGNEIRLSGTVSEFTPGGLSSRNLSTTQLGGSLNITVLSTGNTLPAAVILGEGGRLLPSSNIDDDAFGSFDPITDGIDFFESLEGMRVTAQNLLVVNGTNGFGEIFGVVDNGAGATGLSDRGTLNISPDDFNPERVQVQFDSGVFNFDFPDVNVGDGIGAVTGVLGYDFGNFQIVATEDFSGSIQRGGLQPEVSTLTRGNDQLTVATYNVLNLDPNDNDGDADIANGQFAAIARQIINNLNSPDIIALQEVQDNSGSLNDGVTAANLTLQTLVDAIAAAGGPTYAFIDNPFITNNASGGQPGANIRTAYLYDPSRVSFVEDSLTTIGSQQPGEAFAGARLPLVADFEFNGETVTLVNNHFSSKGGSAPILGTAQPFESRQEDSTVNGSLDDRQAQSQAVQDYVNGRLGNDPTAKVIVLGDFNEFEFVSPVRDLAANTGLTNLTELLPENERYTFIFQGNSQSIDHILVSGSLANRAEIDIVNVNTEFAESLQASDHDPVLARFTIAAPNVIRGTSQRDVLTGSDRNDIFLASGGPDRITTGGGRDRIVFTNTSQTGVTITDFEVGVDKLVLTDLLASVGYTGNNPLADGLIKIRSLGNSDRTQLSLELDRIGGGRTQFTNFLTFEGVSAAELSNLDNFFF
ncbi:endonuclease/exonuclease/phosphatase family protein [Synechococcus elongatus FACHB-1061]|nr:endonuclease/exonuclease/phosphatase family protein [Synechococcus elongatus FACHB-242]MBD2688789.1 endonuclease/exonuclease/phosphatase family protein [Synechococcus elongatus FACHB-1061]MBD2707860.1 endonuclease/exonuclease/phosphatase family protein [Synechococcus elongatus PCC 7942 = FACHB-805]